MPILTPDEAAHYHARFSALSTEALTVERARTELRIQEDGAEPDPAASWAARHGEATLALIDDVLAERERAVS